MGGPPCSGRNRRRAILYDWPASGCPEAHCPGQHTDAWKHITLFSAPAGPTAAGKDAQTPWSCERPGGAPSPPASGPLPNDFLPLSPSPARRRLAGPAIFWPMIAIQAQTDISACTCLIFNQYLNHLYSRMGGCPGRAGRSALEKPRRTPLALTPVATQANIDRASQPQPRPTPREDAPRAAGAHAPALALCVYAAGKARHPTAVTQRIHLLCEARPLIKHLNAATYKGGTRLVKIYGISQHRNRE